VWVNQAFGEKLKPECEPELRLSRHGILGCGCSFEVVDVWGKKSSAGKIVETEPNFEFGLGAEEKLVLERGRDCYSVLK